MQYTPLLMSPSLLGPPTLSYYSCTLTALSCLSLHCVLTLLSSALFSLSLTSWH